jgi:type III secretory pathway component EscS
VFRDAENWLCLILTLWGTVAGAVVGLFIGAIAATPSEGVTIFGMLAVGISLAFVGALGGFVMSTELSIRSADAGHRAD